MRPPAAGKPVQTAGSGGAELSTAPQSTVRQSANRKHAVNVGGGRTLPYAVWKSYQSELDCWMDNGAWVRDAAAARLYPFDNAFHWSAEQPACNPARRPGVDFAWKVNRGATCALSWKPWSRRTFCGALRGRSLLVVGDSLHAEFHDTVASAMQDEHFSCFRPGTKCNGHVICNDASSGKMPARFRYVRDNYFVLSNNAKLNADTSIDWTKAEARAALKRAGPSAWVDALASTDILLVNRGAHYVSDELLVPQLTVSLSYVREVHPRITIIYRTTPPGHKDCAKFPVPWSSRSQRQDATVQSAAALPYHWGQFTHQNALTRQLLDDRFPGVILMDADAYMALRPDSHVRPAGNADCLHYCVPGPIDTWLVHVPNMLALLDAKLAGES